MATYQQIVEGYHARFATLGTIEAILAYEPPSITVFPTLYTILDSYSWDVLGGYVDNVYTLMHRLCFEWQDQEAAELQLMPFIDSIPAVIEADPKLGGVLDSGQPTNRAKIYTARGGFISVSGSVLRVVDFYSETIVTRKWTSDLAKCE